MKKVILSLVLVLLTIVVSSKNYYVSTSGNDANNGLSITTPWKTLTKVQSSMVLFTAGDSILFKKGDTFAGALTISKSGTLLNPLVFGAYGTGTAPTFIGTGVKVNDLFNVYKQSYIVIDGFKITDPTLTSDTLRTQLSKIQCAITLDQCSYCTVKNCDISLVGTGIYMSNGGGHHLIDSNTIYNLRMIVNDVGGYNDYGANPITLSSSNITITNNTLYGAWAKSYDFTYDGGAIEFYDNGVGVSNNFIAYNTIYDCNGTMEIKGVCNNNTIAYNKFANNYSLTYFQSSCIGWKFYNNVIIETKPSLLGVASFMLGGTSGTTSSISFINNVFQLSTGVDVINTSRFTTTHTNNVYKLSNNSLFGLPLSSNEKSTTLTIFINTTNTNPALWDLRPSSTSILINNGTNVGLTRDFIGTRIIGNPDIGVYEVK